MIYIDEHWRCFSNCRERVAREEDCCDVSLVMDIVSLKPKTGRLGDAFPPGIPKLCLLERL